MVITFDSSRRPCDSDAFATSSYETNFAQPLSADTLVSAAVRVVLPWSMWPMVPTFTCGLLRSNFSLAMSSTPLRFYSTRCGPPSRLALWWTTISWLAIRSSRRRRCILRDHPGAKDGADDQD